MEILQIVAGPSVMIGGQRVNAGLDIGEVLLEKDGHIRVKARC